jgi:hypothetical protein
MHHTPETHLDVAGDAIGGGYRVALVACAPRCSSTPHPMWRQRRCSAPRLC